MLADSPIKSIIMFALPIMMSSMLQYNYAFVDNIIVGRYVSSQALAAVGSVGSIGSFIVGAALGLTSGFSIPVSHAFGARDKEKVAAKLKLIWKAPDEKSARAMKAIFCQEYEKSFPKAVECLEEGFEDSIQFYAFEELDSRKISSTNTLERLNREIRRRSSVVGIFPSTDSYIRLITSYLLEYSDDWQTERCYMNAGSIKLQKEILFNAA
jgi:hypothetical protein